MKIINLFILFGILNIAACGDQGAQQKAGKSDSSRFTYTNGVLTAKDIEPATQAAEAKSEINAQTITNKAKKDLEEVALDYLEYFPVVPQLTMWVVCYLRVNIRKYS